MVCAGCIFNHSLAKPTLTSLEGCHLARYGAGMASWYQNSSAEITRSKEHDRTWNCLRPAVFAWTFQVLDMNPLKFPCSFERNMITIIFSCKKTLDQTWAIFGWLPSQAWFSHSLGPLAVEVVFSIQGMGLFHPYMNEYTVTSQAKWFLSCSTVHVFCWHETACCFKPALLSSWQYSWYLLVEP